MKHILLAFAAPTVLGTACFLQGPSSPGQTDSGSPDPTTDGGQPFTADPPSVYVAKAKNVLTGLAVTQQEIDAIASVQDEPGRQAALVTLIDQWMTLPEYSDKMLGFFQRALQQTQISTADFMDIIPTGGILGLNSLANNLLQNITESFARTMLALLASARPLTDAFTTNQLMMTPALMELYGYLDASQAQDDETLVDSFAAANKSLSIVLEDTTPIPPSHSADPTSSSYMNWYYPSLVNVPVQAGCAMHQRVYTAHAHTLHNIMYGGVEGVSTPAICVSNAAGFITSAQLTPSDFTSWKLVTVRAPVLGETTTRFFDVGALRSAKELVLKTPRLGFFSTPAFEANWPTNTSNMMRVTANQAFIVALGAQVDGTDPTNPGANPPGLDPSHVAGGAACLGCHQTLDPSRSILQATYSYGYGQQASPTLQGQTGWFVFNGVLNKNIFTVTDYAAQLASHPLFPSAWVQKLCYYANSRACAVEDAEFQRIVADFKSSGFQWKKLIEDVLSSPVTTNAVLTTTASELGEVVSIARRDHLCTLLDARLGLIDVCGLKAVTGGPLTAIQQIASGLPSDGYGRGAPIPVLPAQPTLFYRAAMENLCEDVANEIIDATSPPAGATTYSSATFTAAIADFVGTLMAITPNDPRSADIIALLVEHYNEALAQLASPASALKSTFVTACLSPAVSGIGM